MKRFFWKELHERGIWLMLCFISVAMVAAFGKGQAFLGNSFFNSDPLSLWALLPLGLAMLSGLSAYGSELVGERGTFIYSRAISWKLLLLAKILPGLAVTVLAPVIGAIICRLTAPVDYLPFISITSLAWGALSYSTILTAAYLIGVCCSIALPGIAGSILTLFLWIAAFYVVGFTILEGDSSFQPVAFSISYGLAPLLAVIVIARFGLTLSKGARLIRFLILMLVPMIVGLRIDFIPSVQHLFRSDGHQSYSQVIVNPSGTMALANIYKDSHENHYWILLPENKVIPLGEISHNHAMPEWINAKCVGTESTIMWWSNGGVLSEKLPEGMIKGNIPHYLASPDEKRVLASLEDGIMVFNVDLRKWQTIISLPYIDGSKHISVIPDGSEPFARCWWQSNDEIGYIHPETGKRILVKVM